MKKYDFHQEQHTSSWSEPFLMIDLRMLIIPNSKTVILFTTSSHKKENTDFKQAIKNLLYPQGINLNCFLGNKHIDHINSKCRETELQTPATPYNLCK